MMIYTGHIIYYSKNGTSDVEHFEMANNYDYCTDITAQKQGLPSVSTNDG